MSLKCVFSDKDYIFGDYKNHDNCRTCKNGPKIPYIHDFIESQILQGVAGIRRKQTEYYGFTGNIKSTHAVII